eukprot:1145222-Pelagomonas_calceolata.AAC.1
MAPQYYTTASSTTTWFCLQLPLSTPWGYTKCNSNGTAVVYNCIFHTNMVSPAADALTFALGPPYFPSTPVFQSA